MMNYDEVGALVKGDLIQNDETKEFRIIHRSWSLNSGYVVMNPVTKRKHGVLTRRAIRQRWTKIVANTDVAKALYAK